MDVVDKDGFAWKCGGMRLRHGDGDVWFWIVDYEYLPTMGMSSGIPARFSVPVLADGSIPKPIVEIARPRD